MSSHSVNNMINYLRENKIDGITQALGIFLFHLMLFTGLIQIVNRFVNVSIPLYWAGEVTRTLMVFLTLVAVPYLFIHNQDISFLPVVEKLPARYYNTVILIRNLLVFIIAAIMVWSAYLSYFQSGDITLPTIQWFFIRWIYAAMGLAFFLLSIAVVVDTAKRFRTLVGERRDRTDV